MYVMHVYDRCVFRNIWISTPARARGVRNVRGGPWGRAGLEMCVGICFGPRARGARKRKAGGRAESDQRSVVDLEEELVFLGVEARGGDGPRRVGLVELEESASRGQGKGAPRKRRRARTMQQRGGGSLRLRFGNRKIQIWGDTLNQRILIACRWRSTLVSRLVTELRASLDGFLHIVVLVLAASLRNRRDGALRQARKSQACWYLDRFDQRSQKSSKNQ
jgi:hypothetical protein